MVQKQLYPVFDIPQLEIEGQASNQDIYKKSYLFDFRNGDFVADGAGKVQYADEYLTWAQWCMKQVLTPRGKCRAYSARMGIDEEEIRRQPTREAAESVMERTVTEALLVSPRTESVRDFIFTWNGDNLMAEYQVYPKNGAPLTMSTQTIR